MRFLADESLHGAIAAALRELVCDVQPVAPPGLSDDRILALAVSSDRIVLTQDADFGDLIFRDGQTAPGIVLVRPGPRNAEDASDIARRIALAGNALAGRFTTLSIDGQRSRPLP